MRGSFHSKLRFVVLNKGCKNILALDLSITTDQPAKMHENLFFSFFFSKDIGRPGITQQILRSIDDCPTTWSTAAWHQPQYATINKHWMIK